MGAVMINREMVDEALRATADDSLQLEREK